MLQKGPGLAEGHYSADYLYRSGRETANYSGEWLLKDQCTQLTPHGVTVTQQMDWDGHPYYWDWITKLITNQLICNYNLLNLYQTHFIIYTRADNSSGRKYMYGNPKKGKCTIKIEFHILYTSLIWSYWIRKHLENIIGHWVVAARLSLFAVI